MSAEEISLSSEEHPPALKVSIVGIGGAGNNLVSCAITRGIDPKHCVAVNNDTAQLSRSAAPNKVFIGRTLPGHSIHANSTSTAKLLQSSAHRVGPFTQNSDFTILVAGLGGDTATVTAPLIAQYNRTLVKPVVSIVAIPFIHERERRFVALRGLKKMVESCDCTIVVDNSMEANTLDYSDRVADATASYAMQALSQIATAQDSTLTQRVLDCLSVGDITVICTASWTHRDSVQSAVFAALKTPSAKVAIPQTRAAVLVYSGPGEITTTQAVKAYETIVSLVGHNIRFVYTSITGNTEPKVSIFLSGYTYEMTLGSFVDFVDLYDLEYGQDSPSSPLGFNLSLFEMEEAVGRSANE